MYTLGTRDSKKLEINNSNAINGTKEQKGTDAWYIKKNLKELC